MLIALRRGYPVCLSARAMKQHQRAGERKNDAAEKAGRKSDAAWGKKTSPAAWGEKKGDAAGQFFHI